jgi:hypothetical protein
MVAVEATPSLEQQAAITKAAHKLSPRKCAKHLSMNQVQQFSQTVAQCSRLAAMFTV